MQAVEFATHLLLSMTTTMTSRWPCVVRWRNASFGRRWPGDHISGTTADRLLIEPATVGSRSPMRLPRPGIPARLWWRHASAFPESPPDFLLPLWRHSLEISRLTGKHGRRLTTHGEICMINPFFPAQWHAVPLKIAEEHRIYTTGSWWIHYMQAVAFGTYLVRAPGLCAP